MHNARAARSFSSGKVFFPQFEYNPVPIANPVGFGMDMIDSSAQVNGSDQT